MEDDFNPDDTEIWENLLPEVEDVPEITHETPEADPVPEMTLATADLADLVELPEPADIPEADGLPEADFADAPEADGLPEADFADAPEADGLPEADFADAPEADPVPEFTAEESADDFAHESPVLQADPAEDLPGLSFEETEGPDLDFGEPETEVADIAEMESIAVEPFRYERRYPAHGFLTANTYRGR